MYHAHRHRSHAFTTTLDFLLLQTMFPDRYERRDAVFAVIHQDHPVTLSVSLCCTVVTRNSHSVRVHGLADEEVIVLEVTRDLLCLSARSTLECFDLLFARTLVLESFLHSLHVALEMSEIALLVELRWCQSERVYGVDHGLGCIVGALFGFFGGRVRASIKTLPTDGDL